MADILQTMGVILMEAAAAIANLGQGMAMTREKLLLVEFPQGGQTGPRQRQT